jgi:hypothetical protein
MMTGSGPFGAMEMGGMFSVVKVREGLARDDYKDPGWYQHPEGSVAYELKGDVTPAARKPAARDEPAMQVRKPGTHKHGH